MLACAASVTPRGLARGQDGIWLYPLVVVASKLLTIFPRKIRETDPCSVWSDPAGLWLAAALRPRGHNKCAELWAAAAAAEAAGPEAARMMSRRSRGRNSAHDVHKYSNPGKESWSGTERFAELAAGAGVRGSRLRTAPPHARRGAAYKYW